MLVSLSLAHLSNKSFPTNEAMCRFLKDNSILESDEAFESLMKIDRKKFVGGDDAGRDLYSLQAARFSEGVDVSNPLMHAIVLECLVNTLKNRNQDQAHILDVGCASGVLTQASLFIGERIGVDTKATGIDIDPKVIEFARTVNEQLNSKCKFYEDNVFNHLAHSPKYTHIISGCGIMHSDALSLIYANPDYKEKCTLIAPIFTSPTSQSLRIYVPNENLRALESSIRLNKIFGSSISKTEIDSDNSYLDLFTCFFTPITYPGYSTDDVVENADVSNASFLDSGEGYTGTNFKRMSVKDLEKHLTAAEAEILAITNTIKKEGQKVSLDAIRNNRNGAEVLERVALIKRILKVKQQLSK